MLALALSVAAPAGAQTGGAQPSSAQANTAAYQATFDAMSADLADPEKSFAFVQAAIAAGDVRGAIGALERILMINPRLDNIRLELGLLYLETGQPELAERLISSALASPGVTPDVRARAERALSRAQDDQSKWRFGGGASFGVQWESNPNAAPEAALASGFGGAPVLIPGDALSVQADGDFAFVGGAFGEARYALGGQAGHEAVLNGSLFQSVYGDNDDLNTTLANVSIGPRFFLGQPLAPNPIIRPFVSASYLGLGGETYATSWGAGATADLRVGDAAALTLTAAYDDRDFSGTSARPTADNQSGGYTTYSARISGRIARTTIGAVSLFGEHVEAEADFESRDRLGVRVDAQTYFEHSPFGPLSLLAALSYRRSEYDRPDPFVDPLHARTEDRTEISFEASRPISDGAAIAVQLEHAINDSNLPNYEYDNTIVGVSLRFSF